MSESNKRYKVIPGSESAHCCFSATVVDTENPVDYKEGGFETVCECFNEQDAELVCMALNKLCG